MSRNAGRGTTRDASSESDNGSAKAARKSVAVQIAGHEYKIRSEGDPSALREIARYVDRAMARVQQRTGTVDSLDVAVLTCLNLAREILALHEQQGDAVAEDRMRSLIDRVEAVLVDAGAEGVAESSSSPASEAAASSEAASDGSISAPQGELDVQEPARTLDLPSVESMRERAAADRKKSAEASGAQDAADAAIPEARVAAGGGRERSS